MIAIRLLSIALFTVSVASTSGAVELDRTQYQKLHAEIQPAEDELWRTIPWKIDLLEAQAVAAKQRKPILIWAMDGHPLGCT